jgi:hypothetical protein
MARSGRTVAIWCADSLGIRWVRSDSRLACFSWVTALDDSLRRLGCVGLMWTRLTGSVGFARTTRLTSSVRFDCSTRYGVTGFFGWKTRFLILGVLRICDALRKYGLLCRDGALLSLGCLVVCDTLRSYVG